MRVLLVSENASMRMGGEATYGVFFYRLLRERGVETWLLAHDRVRNELKERFPDEIDRMFFVDDTALDKNNLQHRIPRKFAEQTIVVALQYDVQRRMRKLARRLVPELGIDLVHQVYPLSPKAVSGMYGLGAPVVIGPLSGAMDYPPAFQHRHGWASKAVERVGRSAAHAVNRLLPGKLRADALIVANEQTRAALPKGSRGVVYPGISEVSVDTRVWTPRSTPVVDRPEREEVRFVFLGRFINWKGVDLLLDAFKRVLDQPDRPRVVLELLGDGVERANLEKQAAALNLGEAVRFVGWLSPQDAARRMEDSDVFVLPSLRESGGIVLMEAMALGLPIVTSHWGGPGQHVDDQTGFRVAPSSQEGFVAGLAEAMLRLARSRELRVEMGRAGLARVETGTYTWDRKIDRVLEIYDETLARTREPAAAGATSSR
ncbi:MAG: glycosyltransferase family 4 protein [Isosphaeraceae bacterium]